ncbi:MAG: ribosome biogenesis factor YjgA [Methylococcaceae bacterium]
MARWEEDIEGQEDEEAEDDFVSKSALKRQDRELQKLAAELAELPPGHLQDMKLPESLRLSVRQAASLPASGARKRQVKYIGGLLRDMDIAPIVEKIATLKNQNHLSSQHHHRIERWRDRLIEQGNTALTELLDKYPKTDRQQLRQLIRNVEKEQAQAKPPKHFRELYRYIKQILDDSAE